ncbi:uncharacterized protein N7511_007313 [Penicillium nucicola]|uniref:uncharacterized protein n=1 Tax=Penicillium nucicola TaxID=1850975 RepID=UPI00254591A0|nr:uncharacterized protein N7511_007313 [Penicillium nucicola]KAJ5757131.1 hypothetical protein N7511_007313 [Penicillium nucicola]
MTVNSRKSRGRFETTSRLLAQVVNEGLATATVKTSGHMNQKYLILTSHQESSENPERWVKVGLLPDTHYELRDGRVISLVRPGSFKPVISIGTLSIETEVLEPEEIFEHMRPWLLNVADESLLQEIGRELKNSSDNQEKWLEISDGMERANFDSSSIEWERTMVFGHPSHPYHRLCYAQAPLKPHSPNALPGMLTPSIAFVSVLRIDMHPSGFYEETMTPLLRTLDIPQPSDDRLVVPCLVQQLPAVKTYFPSAVVVKIIEECVDAQASMRTLTSRPELGFPYHLKLSLACNITSALRTITPWSTMGGPVFSELLERFLPPDLWVFREIGSITGSQSDFNKAKHFSCILRDNLETKAQANDETLILAAALAQHPPEAKTSYAESLYNLENVQKKKDWFRKYTACLFKLTIPPLLQYGIALKAHGQNIVVRVCRQTGDIKGFAVRDFGGIRLHVPTLREYCGGGLDAIPSGSAVLTSNLHNAWSKVHHSLLQNHVGFLLSALGLEQQGGWTIVREELANVLNPNENIRGRKLYDFFVADTMPFKCFLMVRMEGKYRDYVERELPNIVAMNSPRWKEILKMYQPRLHRT